MSMSKKKSREQAVLEETTQTQGGHSLGQRNLKVQPEKKKQSGEKIAESNIRNITERQQAEEALQESQQSYQKLVEQIPGVIYRDALDEKASTLFISPQIKDLTGYAPEKWMANPDLWAKLLHPDDRARVLAENKHHLATGEQFKSDYRLLARDGRIVWVRDEAVTIRDSSGHPLYDQGIFTDITDRKRAEEALRENEKKYRTLFDTLPEAITLLDLKGNIIECNERTVELAGIPKEELIGKNFTKLGMLNIQDIPKYFKLFAQMLAGKQESYLEVEIMRGDERHRLEVFVSLLTEGGHSRAIQVIVRDITERKRAKEEIKTQLDELQRWQAVTLGRESRILDLKREVNELLGKAGQPPRYASAEDPKGLEDL